MHSEVHHLLTWLNNDYLRSGERKYFDLHSLMAGYDNDLTFLNHFSAKLEEFNLCNVERKANGRFMVQITEFAVDILRNHGSLQNYYKFESQRESELRRQETIARITPSTTPNAQLAQRLKSRGILTASVIWKGVKWLIGVLTATGVIGLAIEYGFVQPYYESRKGKQSPVDSPQNLNRQSIPDNAANAKVKKPDQKKDSSESHKKNSVLKIVKSGVISDTTKGN